MIYIFKMKKMKIIFQTVLLIIFLAEIPLYSQSSSRRYMDKLSDSISPSRKIIYKEIDNYILSLHILEAEDKASIEETRPCIVGIHGGGWNSGDPSMTYAILWEFVQRGWIGISIEYRLLDISKKNTIIDSVKDVKSAIRYIKMHAQELGIDSTRITLCGLSAGGHLAVGTILFDTINEESDNKLISTMPQHLILYYPVVDTSSRGYGNHKIGKNWEKLSPLHNIKENMPPTLIFHGMKDNVVPLEGILEFQRKMVEFDNSCDLIIHGEGSHGYFLYDKALYEEVIEQTFCFLKRWSETSK